jgi:hypothetical protein
MKKASTGSTGHGHRHLVERNALEKSFHVLHRADGHPRHACKGLKNDFWKKKKNFDIFFFFLDFFF